MLMFFSPRRRYKHLTKWIEIGLICQYWPSKPLAKLSSWQTKHILLDHAFLQIRMFFSFYLILELNCGQINKNKWRKIHKRSVFNENSKQSAQRWLIPAKLNFWNFSAGKIKCKSEIMGAWCILLPLGARIIKNPAQAQELSEKRCSTGATLDQWKKRTIPWAKNHRKILMKNSQSQILAKASLIWEKHFGIWIFAPEFALQKQFFFICFQMLIDFHRIFAYLIRHFPKL
jgi:hypothetical protein